MTNKQPVKSIVEELNGYRLIERDEEIKAFAGEIILPLAEFEKALHSYTAEREVIQELPDWYKNEVREEMVDWFKSLPWWRRLFKKFEV